MFGQDDKQSYSKMFSGKVLSPKFSLILFLILFALGCQATQPTITEEPVNLSPTSQPLPVPLLEDVDPLTWTYATVDLDGTTIDYATLLPPEFDSTKAYPLLLALPPGGQDKGMVDAGLETFWKRGALYGFIIVSPVKPVGTSYRSDGSLILPAFVAFLQDTYQISEGKPHLGGVSNGGISTFKAGLEQPELYQSLTVLPGYAANDADLITLADLRINLFVGANDGGWVTSSERTYNALVDSGHNDVYLEIFPDTGHLILPLSGNGIGQVFERLLHQS